MTDGEKAGTFLVTEVDEESAVIRDVADGQVHTLAENPGLDEDKILEATLTPEPPMEVAWVVKEVVETRSIPIERSPEPPTKQAQDIAADQPVGEMTRRERAGEGELHILTVPEHQTDQAATEVTEDETTLTQAARMGVDRVEVRAADGVVSVRYLPS